MRKSKYPEHAKLEKVVDKSQIIGEFLAWLPTSRYCIAEEGDDGLYDTQHTNTQILAAYFGVDLDRLSAEKDKMLAELRAENERLKKKSAP